MIGKLGILITILSLVFLFFIVISLGAGGFSKKEKKTRNQKISKVYLFFISNNCSLGINTGTISLSSVLRN